MMDRIAARIESMNEPGRTLQRARIEGLLADWRARHDAMTPDGQYWWACTDAWTLARIWLDFRAGRHEEVLAKAESLAPLPSGVAILPNWRLIRDEIHAAAEEAREALASR
jgi:hypothetical protein